MPVQRAVSTAVLTTWSNEHNQTIPLESGSKTSALKTVSFDDGDITVTISEHAANHFVNRHTLKEFSFKDENIKRVNSFWPDGATKDTVSTKAETVLTHLAEPIKDMVYDTGEGAVVSKNDTVAGMTVGYNITLAADFDSYDEGTEKYTKGTGCMNMFYPEGQSEYRYYSQQDLVDIRAGLQAHPYNKVLQLKTLPKNQLPVVQRKTFTIVEAAPILIPIFQENVFLNFKTAVQELARHHQVQISLDEIPEYLIDKLKDPNIPHYYLPSTYKIWEAFITKILKYENSPLSEANLPEIDLTQEAESDELKSRRGAILEKLNKDSAAVDNVDYNWLYKSRYDKIKPLGQKILNAQLTSNFALDTLIKYQSPHMLNAFEVKERIGDTSQNIVGDLESTRREKEEELFELPPDTAARMRPRYAALNFHGHEYGAAARNDYGLCHMVFKDHVKERASFTYGDTFDTLFPSFPLTHGGVEALLRTLAMDGSMFEEHMKLLDDKTYDPGDTYFDTQIHQDIDIRKDVREIVVSKAEMSLFNISLDLVDKLIHNLTGGVFVRAD